MNTIKGTFSAIIHVFSLCSREHGHGVTSVIFIERSIDASLNALHPGKSTQESRRAKAVVIIKASKLGKNISEKRWERQDFDTIGRESLGVFEI